MEKGDFRFQENQPTEPPFVSNLRSIGKLLLFNEKDEVRFGLRYKEVSIDDSRWIFEFWVGGPAIIMRHQDRMLGMLLYLHLSYGNRLITAEIAKRYPEVKSLKKSGKDKYFRKNIRRGISFATRVSDLDDEKINFLNEVTSKGLEILTRSVLDGNPTVSP